MMSVMVVTKMLAASAGSTPQRRKPNGTATPANAPMIWFNPRAFHCVTVENLALLHQAIRVC